MIASNKTRIEVAGPNKQGKYAGWILIDEDRWSPILNTEPVFNTKEQVIEEMEKLIKEIKEYVAKETGPEDQATHLMKQVGMTDKEAGIVKAIIGTAQTGQ